MTMKIITNELYILMKEVAICTEFITLCQHFVRVETLSKVQDIRDGLVKQIESKLDNPSGEEAASNNEPAEEIKEQVQEMAKEVNDELGNPAGNVEDKPVSGDSKADYVDEFGKSWLLKKDESMNDLKERIKEWYEKNPTPENPPPIEEDSDETKHDK